jgi:signal transduction histidine kinase
VSKNPSAGGRQGDDAAGDRDDTGDLRLRLVQGMLWTALGLIMLVRLLSAWQEQLPWPAVFVAMIPYPALVGLLLGPRDPGVRGALLAALVALYATPFALVGTHWDWLPWPLAVAALCAFRGRVGWPLFGLVLVATYAAGLMSGDDALTASHRTYKTANDGLIVFGLYALATMVAQLHATRGELARCQLLRERNRLHGELLTVVSGQLRVLEQQLTRAVDADPQAARDLLGTAIDTAREALASIRETAGDYRSRLAAPITPIDSPRVARLVLAAVYLCESLNLVADALTDYHRPWTMLLMAPLMCASGAVLLLMRPSRRQMILLGVLLGPTALPLGYLVWELTLLSCLWPFLLGLVLTGVRRPLSWVLCGLATVLYMSTTFYPPPVPNLAGMAGNLTSMIILSWLSYSLIRLSRLVTVLHRTRRDLAREALVRERTRVARDLHDMASFSLSAVALNGELCLRLLESDPARARERLATLPELAARALAEVESVITRPAVLRADEEVVAARAVLEIAGVRPTLAVHVDPLPASVDAAVAAVLREAVTNIVRHSQARTCTIAITSAQGLVRLRVVNDGVLPVAAGGPQRRGSGLIGIAERTGGHMSAGLLPDGRFELVAQFATGVAAPSADLTSVATVATGGS